MPAGAPYTLYVYPPAGWKVLGGNPTSAQVFGKDTSRLFLEVQRGTGRAPTPPRKCN